MVKGIRLSIVVITVIVSLVVIFGGQYLLNYLYFAEPFREKVLSINGIKDMRLVEIEEGYKVYLKAEEGINLQTAYNQVLKLSEEMIKGQVNVEMENENSILMRKVYDEIHLAIYEGIANGRFTEMAVKVKEIARNNHIEELDIKVDNNNVYLAMSKDKEVYCQVIPRNEGVMTYFSQARGGEGGW